MEFIKCDKCEGKGFVWLDRDEFPFPSMSRTCEKCYGKKELDWIENIVGVKKGYTEFIIESKTIKPRKRKIDDNKWTIYQGTDCKYENTKCKL